MSETEDPNLKAVAENMSEITPEVIAKQKADSKPATAPAKASAPPKRGYTDRQGRSFDPSLHEVDEQGNPRLNRDGFLAGKPGRPGKGEKIQASNPSPSPDREQDKPDAPTASELANNQSLAKITTSLFINISVGVFGEEWLPRRYRIPDMGVTIDEQLQMQEAFEQYFRAKNMKDLTPGWALVFALSGYAAARMTQPKTQSRFKIITAKAFSFGAKLFGKVTGFFKRIFLKGVKTSAAHADFRDNGVRQDNSSPEASQTVQP